MVKEEKKEWLRRNDEDFRFHRKVKTQFCMCVFVFGEEKNLFVA